MTRETTSTLAFWFSDLQSSTQMWERHPEAMGRALERHDSILRNAIEGTGGLVVKTTGDGFMAVFEDAAAAATAGIRAQQRMGEAEWEETGPLRVRIGMHTGEAHRRVDDYFGPVVNRTARIMAAGHGGQILLSDSIVAAIGSALPRTSSLRDLGEHRLKDLAAPQRLYQLVAPGLHDTFPALTTLDLRPNNLPTQASVFLGREMELGELRELIETAGTRLVTLTGPGGTGKTRLALQAAADQVDRFEDGLFFVDLSSERDAGGAFSAILRTVEIEGGAADTEPLEALKEGLGRRHMLLLLDNLEQVTEAAAGLAQILQACPDVTLMATSREALRVRGERLYPVAPLSLPPTGNGSIPAIETVLESEAVRLFVERAVELRPDFEITADNTNAIVEICRRLDGMPLAIELATARLKLFTPHALQDRLERRFDLLRGGARDLPDRQQTLRATLEWSYELLGDEERQLLQLIGVFSGARFEAVEDVAARTGSLASIDVIGGLESLVDKSLVRGVDETGPWFSMLQTIRAYAAERLAEDTALSAAVRRAHAEYYCELATELRSRLTGPHREETLGELEQNLGNLQEAWRFWVGEEDLERLYDLLDALWVLNDSRGWYRGVIELASDLLAVLALGPETPERVREEIALQTSVARALMTLRGYTAEVEQAFTRALQLSEDAGHTPERFPVLRSLASLYALRYENEKALEVGRELLEIAERQDDPVLQVDANLVVGAGLAFTRHPDEGLQLLNKAVELFDPEAERSERFHLGPNPGVVALTTSAIILWVLGFPERAMERVARAEDASALLAHPATRCYALHHASLAYAQSGRVDLLAERAAEQLRLANTNEYPVWRALALVWQAVAEIGAGNVDEGIARLGRGMVLYQGETTPPVFWPTLLTIQASANAMAGRSAEGLELVDEALTFYRMDDPGWLDATILRADLLVGLGTQIDEAANSYETARRTAHEYGARMLELRAATRLAQLRHGTPAGDAALRDLEAVYRTFTEGFDTPDLVLARSRLEAR